MSASSPSVGMMVLLCAVAAPARAAVQKAPYLLFTGQSTSMDVMWQSTITEVNVIRWGTTASYELGEATSSEYGSDHQHRHTFSGLAPNTLYYYQVDGFGSGSFRTAPPSTQTAVSLWAISDTQFDPPVHESVVGQIRSEYLAAPAKQSLILHTGDWAMDDSEDTWTNEFFLSAASYPQVAAQLAEVPLAGVRGNHDESGTVSKKYLPFPYAGGFYWSFDYGPVHVTVVDLYSSYAAGSAEYNWIANDLASTTKPWKIVLMHEGAWSAGGDHTNSATIQAVLHPLFKQHRVDIVLNGHNHYYARAVVDGIQYVTNGGAGGELAAADPTYPNIVKAVSTHCFVGLDIEDATLLLTARTDTGELIENLALTHDAQAPVVSVTSPAADTVVTGTATITATATDDVGVTEVDFFVDGAAIGSASGSPFAITWDTDGVVNGPHTLTASAYDARGNVGQSPAVTVTTSNTGADTRPPTTVVTTPGAGATVSGTVTATASATDNVGVTRVELYVDGTLTGTATAAPYSFAWNTTTVANGSHAITSKAYDDAGNVGTSAAVSVSVSNPVELANGVAITLSGALESQAVFYVDVPSGVTNLQIAMSGGTGDADLYTRFGSVPTLTAYDCRPYAIGNAETCRVTTPSAGRYWVMVDAYSAFASTSLKATFTVPDTTPPTVSVAAPAAGATVTGAVAFTAAASDNVGVSKVEFYVDGALVGSDTTSPYSVNWSSTGSTNGAHSLTTKAYDAAGNVGTSGAVGVTVSNTGTGTALTSGVAVTFSGAKSSKTVFYIDVPSGTTSLVIAMSGGTGDADLYTKAGVVPTTSSYTCRPYTDGNNETCTVAAPAAGLYYMMVHGYTAYAATTLQATLTP